MKYTKLRCAFMIISLCGVMHAGDRDNRTRRNIAKLQTPSTPQNTPQPAENYYMRKLRGIARNLFLTVHETVVPAQTSIPTQDDPNQSDSD